MYNAPFKVGDILTITDDFYKSYPEIVLFRNPFKLTNDLILDVNEGYLVKTQIVSENKFVKYVTIPSNLFKIFDDKVIDPPLNFKEKMTEESSDLIFETELLKKINEIVSIMLENQKTIDFLKKKIEEMEGRFEETTNDNLLQEIKKIKDEVRSGKIFADSLELVVKKRRKSKMLEN
ncbi:MAG: hypothetical protein RI943_835 [Bacteroidota bacterium]|jgi:hypothetical protein